MFHCLIAYEWSIILACDVLRFLGIIILLSLSNIYVRAFWVFSVPEVAPHVPVGWFRTESCDSDNCTVILYWKVSLSCIVGLAQNSVHLTMRGHRQKINSFLCMPDKRHLK